MDLADWCRQLLGETGSSSAASASPKTANSSAPIAQAASSAASAQATSSSHAQSADASVERRDHARSRSPRHPTVRHVAPGGDLPPQMPVLSLSGARFAAWRPHVLQPLEFVPTSWPEGVWHLRVNISNVLIKRRCSVDRIDVSIKHRCSVDRIELPYVIFSPGTRLSGPADTHKHHDVSRVGLPTRAPLWFHLQDQICGCVHMRPERDCVQVRMRAGF